MAYRFSMEPPLPRFGRALCRILGILALVGQMAMGGLTPVDPSPGAGIPTPFAISDFCHSGTPDTGDDGGQPCHCHDLSPCLPAGIQQLPHLLAAVSPTLPPRPGMTVRRQGMPPGARSPPSWRVQSGTARGPPAIQA